MNATSKSVLPAVWSWQIACAVALLAAGVCVAGITSVLRVDAGTLIGCLLLVFCAVVLWPMLSDLRHGSFDPLQSRNVFLFLFSLYAITLPLLTYLQGDSVSGLVDSGAIT